MTASDARPPSDTGTTGWHRHDGDDAVWAGSDCVHVGVITGAHQRSRPVIVVDPAEARETLALFLHVDRMTRPEHHADCQPFSYDYDQADRILAALGGQEGDQP